MKLDPWFPATDVREFPPDRIVHTLQLSDDMLTDLWCDVAWTTPEEVENHHWIRTLADDPGTRVVRCRVSVREYLKHHVRFIRGMNAFWDRGRDQFLAAWEALHGPLGIPH